MKGAFKANEAQITQSLIQRRLRTMEWNHRRPMTAAVVLDPETGLPVTGATYSDIPAYMRKRVRELRADNAQRMLRYTEEAMQRIEGEAA